MSEEGWIILRCAGRSTLRLAETLAEDGFDVWTPAKDMRVRRSRWNVSREVRLPLMASFVFARSGHLADLLELSALPIRPRRGMGCRFAAHPDFSVLHHFDRIPVVNDVELQPLRDEVAKAPAAGELANVFRAGERVNVAQGVFGGMSGIVERDDGAFTIVRFGSRMRVKISTFILKPNMASRGYSAARKAA